jgi:pilus assembly protein TadC
MSNLLDSQLGEAARSIAVALRAGYDLDTILKILPDELPAPAGELFARAGAAVRAGSSIQSALSDLSDHYPAQELAGLIAAFNPSVDLAAALNDQGLAIIARCGSDPQTSAAALRLREAVGARPE